MSRIEQLKEFLKETPDDPFLHYALTMEYLKIGDVLEVRNGFEKMVNTFPNYLGTYYHYGKFLEEQNERIHAEEIYNIGVKVAQNANNRHAMSELLGAINLMHEDDSE